MVSVMLYPCKFCVALSMVPFVLCVACLRVFVNCLLKQFAICLGVFVILLLNVMELLSVVGGSLLDRPCMVFHRMCVWVVPVVPVSVYMLLPYYVCLCFCMSEVISSFRILRAGSSYVVSLCDFAYYVFG